MIARLLFTAKSLLFTSDFFDTASNVRKCQTTRQEAQCRRFSETSLDSLFRFFSTASHRLLFSRAHAALTCSLAL